MYLSKPAYASFLRAMKGINPMMMRVEKSLMDAERVK